jgi:hypothetical protein
LIGQRKNGIAVIFPLQIGSNPPVDEIGSGVKKESWFAEALETF